MKTKFLLLSIFIHLFACQSNEDSQRQEKEITPKSREIDTKFAVLPKTQALDSFKKALRDQDPILIKKILNHQLDPLESQEFDRTDMSVKIPLIHHVIANYDQFFEENDPKKCLKNQQISISNQMLDQFKSASFIPADQFRLYQWYVLADQCQRHEDLKAAYEQIQSALDQANALKSKLESEKSDLQNQLYQAIKLVDLYAEGRFLLKGFLVNPFDEIHEISIPNLFKVHKILCQNSTKCEAIEDVRAFVSGGLYERVLLKTNFTNFSSQGRVEIFVKPAGTERIRLKGGGSSEWAVFEEADPSDLFRAQRNQLTLAIDIIDKEKEISKANQIIYRDDIAKANQQFNQHQEYLGNFLKSTQSEFETLNQYNQNNQKLLASLVPYYCDLNLKGNLKELQKIHHKSLIPKIKEKIKLAKQADYLLCQNIKINQNDHTNYQIQFDQHLIKNNEIIKSLNHTFTIQQSKEGNPTILAETQQEIDQSKVEKTFSFTNQPIQQKLKSFTPSDLFQKYLACQTPQDAFDQMPSKKQSAEPRLVHQLQSKDQILSISKINQQWSKIEISQFSQPLFIKNLCLQKFEKAKENRLILSAHHLVMKDQKLADLPDSSNHVMVFKENTKVLVLEKNLGAQKDWCRVLVYEGDSIGQIGFIQHQSLVEEI